MQRIKKKIFVYIDSKNDEDGFTLLSSLLRLMMISIVLPLLLFALTKITVLPMQSSMSVHQLFFIIQNELYRASEVTYSKNQLTYINEEGNNRIELYGNVLRRRVNFQGHEVYHQNVKSFSITGHPEGLKVTLTLLSGESYERILLVP